MATHLTILRPHEEGDFEGRDAEIFSLLIRHVRRAVQIHHELFSLYLQKAASLNGLTRPGVGILITDSHGKLLFTNTTVNNFFTGDNRVSKCWQSVESL